MGGLPLICYSCFMITMIFLEKNKIKKTQLSSLLRALALIFIISIILGLKLGYVEVGWSTIINSLLFKLTGITTIGLQSEDITVIYELRLPRVLLAAGIGMGLALSGIVMQAIVQNPLADPYILGLSSGASLGATSAIFLGIADIFGVQSIGISAFLGCLIVSLFIVYLAKTSTHSNNTVKLLLGGMALSAICSSFSSFIVYMGSNKQGMESVTYWLMGSVANARLENVAVLLLIVVIAFIYFSTQSRNLNLLLLGNEQAIPLGCDMKPVVIKYLVINSILVGLIVLNSGTIGFVGLVIPHMVRSILGSNHRKLLPVAVLFGGVFAVMMDIISRVILNGVEIPLGVTFAMIGAPCFIYLMTQRRYKFGGN